MTRKQVLRLIFHEDSLVLIASLAFLWVTISSFTDSYYNFKNLRKHTGRITDIDSTVIKVVNKPLFKQTTKELRITLYNEKKYFTSITTKNFGKIISQISIGDSVNLYTKKKLLGIFGFKKTNEISHLAKNDIVLIDFSDYKQSLPGIFFIALIATIGFFIYYYLRITRRYILNISVNS